MNQPNSRIAPEPSRYPTADELPEMKADTAKGGIGEQPSSDMNPILDALRTLQQYIATAEKRGDASAAAMKESLVSFAKAMAGGAGAGAGASAEAGGEEQMAAEQALASEGEEAAVPGVGGEVEDEGEQEEDVQAMKKRKLNKRIGGGSAVPMV